MCLGHSSCSASTARSRVLGRRASHDGLAERTHQDQPQAGTVGLLVTAHVLEQLARVYARRFGRQAGALEQALDALAIVCGKPAERGRRPRREHHADGDGFAVQPALVAADGLERVAEGVAEIQQRAPALLALVLGDDARP